MIKTKLQVLSNNSLYSDSDDALHSRFGEIESALDEYAKQVAIDFAKFVNSYTLQSLNNNDNWYYEKTYKKYQTVSDEQLFQEYLNSIR